MVALFVHYMRWHYTRAVRDLINIVGNFLWFFYQFFSIPLLLRTLFVPFHRLEEHSHSSLDFSAMAQAILVNSLMRIVGAFLRLFVIVIGLVFLILTCIVGFSMLIIWLFAPLIVVCLLATGVMFLRI